MRSAKLSLFTLSIVAGSMAVAVPNVSATPATSVVPTTRSTYLVTFVDGTNARAEAAQLRAQNYSVSHVYENLFPGVAVELPEAAAQALARNPRVALIEPDGIATISETQTGATWGLDRIDERVRTLDTKFSYPSSAGEGVNAYILDTGILASHQDLAPRVQGGATAISDGRGTSDCNGHGTHVAGTVGGTLYGVAKKVNLIPVRVLDCAGSGSWSGVIAGMDWVAGNRVLPAVANLSLGGGASSSVDAAVQGMVDAGVTVVVAAGNSNRNACNYSPARAPNAVTVGATTSTDARSSFSNFGSCLDLFAPGSGIKSAWYTSTTATATLDGTSMASPHVAGVAALVLGDNKSFTPAQVTNQLVTAATTGVVTSAGTGSPNRLLYSEPGDVTPAGLSITTSSLPTAVVGGSYSTTLQASGGNGTYTWSATGLPAGLTINSSGIISGTPTASGTFAIDVTVTSDVNTASASFNLTVAVAPSITTASLANAVAGSAYSTTLQATGGTGTYTWSATGLPAGLTINSSGTISGTPTASGTFTVNATVTSGGSPATKPLSLTVAFGKLSPRNSATGISRTVTVSWASLNTATSYEVCLGTSTTCSSWINVGTATSYRHSTTLASRTTYYWQVRAVVSGGTVLANSGTNWRFTTVR